MITTARRPWYLVVSLTLAAATLLSACSSTSPPAATATPAEPTSGQAATPSGGATAGTGAANTNVSGNLDLWHFWGSPVRRTAIRRVIAICQPQIPNVKINETFKPFGDIWTANIAAVAAGTGMPDVIVEDRPQLPQRARDKVDQDLQPFIDRDHLDSSVFWPFTWQETLYQDHSYGIPYETDVRVLYWNKNAFKAAGLDPEKPPQSWDDLMTYADKLDIKNSDGSYKRIGFMPLWNVGSDIWARTDGWVQVKDGKPNYNDPAYIDTLAWMKTWIDRYGGYKNVQNFQASYGAAPNDLFMSGAAAMLVDISGYASQLNFYRPQVPKADGSGKETLNWGVSFIPYKKQKADWSGGFALSIPRGAKNPDAAWEFIKCATGMQSQVSWARDTAAMPANQKAANSPELLADANWQVYLDNMKVSTGSVYVPAYPNFTEKVSPNEEKVWNGQMTPQQAAQEIQKEIDDTIAKNPNK